MMVCHRRRIAVLIATLGMTSLYAQDASIVDRTNITASLRTRYGVIDQDGNSGESLSALLRTTLLTSWQESWSSLVELDYVGRGLRDHHSDGVTDNGEPLVPDTAGLDLNQFYLEQNGSGAQWRLGRQRIEYDNQRFVGGNAFWQNEQTFDGLTVQTRFAESSLLQYAYLYNVNRIFGEEAGRQLSEHDGQYGELDGLRPVSRLGDHKLDSHWLRAEWNEWDYHHLSGYAYFNEYRDFAELSHRQAGLRHAFDYKFSSWRLRTQLEYARQIRYELTDPIWTSYELAEAALGYQAFEFAVRHEKLDSRAGRSFIAPLGSSHDFHGLVGKFASTPADGLVEQSARISWRQSPWLIELRQLQFDSAEHDLDYGSETNLTIRWRKNRSHSVMLNGGNFNAATDSPFSDEWRVYLDYRFEF